MTPKELFTEFKKEVRQYLDKNIGFIPGMEIDFKEEDNRIVLLIDDEVCYSTEISDRVPISLQQFINIILYSIGISKAMSLTPEAKKRFNALSLKNQMQNNGLTDKAEEQAVELIKNAVTKHGNGLISGYSGGKDSKVILHLARRACPDIVAVHNSHPEETCDLKHGVVVIKEPKSNFREYLKYVDVTAQIDGTRVWEDGKTVIVNGVEIERDDMGVEDVHNPKGVFDLEFYYPILFWTDKMVWDYIEKYKLMTAYEISIYKPSRPYRGEKY